MSERERVLIVSIGLATVILKLSYYPLPDLSGGYSVTHIHGCGRPGNKTTDRV